MQREFKFKAVFLVLVLSVSSMACAQDLPKVESILAHARESRCEPSSCKGSAEVSNIKHQFQFEFDGKGRFELEIIGPFGRTNGFDEKFAWQVDEMAGIPYDLDLFIGDAFRASHCVWTGDWCQPYFGFEIEDPRKTEEGIELTIQSPRSTYAATLVMDAKTFEPISLTPTGWGATGKTRYLEYKDGLARRIEIEDPAGNLDVLLIEEVELYEKDVNVGCGSKPKTAPRNVSFDSTSDAALEVKHARSGHLLVRPKINGVDVGWFMFDTGAPITSISKSAAEKLGLDEMGRTFIGGAGSELTTVPIHLADSLELGPIRLENPRFIQFETIGRETVGIIGWDVLVHSVVEIDMQNATIEIHPRDSYALETGDWYDMVLHMQHPHVEASFSEGQKGLFRIDTGAGQIGVMFHSPTVKRLDLLANRETKPLRARGAGGDLDLRIGSIDWFEIAGHRTENPQTLFCMDKTGALADGNSLGNLGGGVLAPFILVLDYQGKRVGFVQRDER